MEFPQRRALQRCHSQLVRDLAVEDVLDHLLSKEIITHDDYDTISAERTRRERTQALLRILPLRGATAFQELVAVLRREREWLATSLQTQLLELLNTDSGPAQDEWEAVLRAGAVPSLPAHVVGRHHLRANIRDLLRNMPEGHFVAVHGMPGIGKSVAVNDAVRSSELLRDRFPGGVYWLSVGQVDQDLLLNKVQALCERLSEDSAAVPLPPNMDVALERLRKLLNGVSRRRCLLVLDDVWKSEVVALFDDLGASVLVTTRDASVVDKVADRARLLVMEDGFSLEESTLLFSRRLNMPADSLPDEAADIHRRCGGVPMAIALLCSYLTARGRRPQSAANRWRSCLEKIRHNNWGQLMARNSNNMLEAIGLSVDSLEEDLLLRFHSLVVFGADVSIPEQALCTYWGLDEDEVFRLTSELVKKSLIQEMSDEKLDTMFYMLHDLMVDYLEKALPEEQKRKHHSELVHAYLKACDDDHGRLPDDEYILWYMGYHVYRSGEYALFPQLYFSLRFVGNKLRVTGPSDLLSDYRKYAEFLDRAHNGESRRRDYENFVRTAGHRLPPPPSLPADTGPLVAAADPSAGVVQLALCQPESSAVYQAAEQVAAKVAHQQLYLRWCNKENMQGSNVLLTKVFSGAVCDVVFTNIADLALAAYGDGHIKLWNVISGDEYPAFRGHTERVQQLAVSPDGCNFVSASDDCTLKIWNLEAAIQATYAPASAHHAASPRVRHSSSGLFRGAEEPVRDQSDRTLVGHAAGVMCVDWSSDGARILSGAADGAFKLWDASPLAEDAALHEVYDAHDGNITCCTFSPDASYFATGGADARVKLWQTAQATCIYAFAQHQLRVISLCLSQDNSSIVSVADKEIFCWIWGTDRRPSRDFETLKISSNNEHDLYLCSRLSRDQRHLVVGTSSNMFETWDLRERRVVATQRGFAGSVTSLVFSRDGERLLAGAGNNVTSCSLTTTPKVEESLQTLFAARFPTPDPRSLVVAAITSNNGVQVLTGLEGMPQTTTKPVGEKIRITVINDTGTKVAFGCEDGSVGVYELSAKQHAEPNILGKHSERVISLQFGPGDTVVSGSEDNTMKVWWLDRSNVTCGGNVGAVTQVGLYDSDDGLVAVSCSRDGTLKGAPPLHVSDMEWEALARRNNNVAVVVSVYLAGDGGRLVTAHRAHSGSTVTCYRIVRYRPEDSQRQRSSSPCPPDLVVVTAGVDGMVKMSHLATGHVLKTFNLGYGPVRTLQLSADSTILVTGHDEGHVVVTRTDHQCAPLRLDLHQSWVHDLAVSHDGRTVLSVGDCLAWWRLTLDDCNGHQSRPGRNVPQSPRLQPPARQYYGFRSPQPAAGGLRATLRQVLSFRGTMARQVVVSDDWTTLVTIDDAGVLYVLQVM